MVKKNAPCRMADKAHKPTEEEMSDFIGEQAKGAWTEMRRFIEHQYSPTCDTVFGGAKYGWAIRYRKGGRSLCSLFPECGGFTVLLVLGAKQSEEALSVQEELSAPTRDLIMNARQLHDGRWLWFRVSETGDTRDIKRLLHIKRRPRKARS